MKMLGRHDGAENESNWGILSSQVARSGPRSLNLHPKKLLNWHPFQYCALFCWLRADAFVPALWHRAGIDFDIGRNNIGERGVDEEAINEHNRSPQNQMRLIEEAYRCIAHGLNGEWEMDGNYHEQIHPAYKNLFFLLTTPDGWVNSTKEKMEPPINLMTCSWK